MSKTDQKCCQTIKKGINMKFHMKIATEIQSNALFNSLKSCRLQLQTYIEDFKIWKKTRKLQSIRRNSVTPEAHWRDIFLKKTNQCWMWQTSLYQSQIWFFFLGGGCGLFFFWSVLFNKVNVILWCRCQKIIIHFSKKT